jgi:hypothetical protein
MGETYDAGTLTAELDLDSSKLNKGAEDAKKSLEDVEKSADKTGEALNTLAEIGEALGLAEIFSVIKEQANECIKAFDTNAAALRTMSSMVKDVDVGKFTELAEQLSAVSRNSVATEMTTVSMMSKFSLTDRTIATLLPSVQNFAAAMREDLPSAAQRFTMAISSGEASVRRLGINLGEQGRAAFKAADETGRLSIIMQALSKYNGAAAEDAKTASGAQASMAKASEELHAAIGGIIDQPVASFFNTAAEAINVVTGYIKELSPATKEFLGYAVSIGTTLALSAVGFGAVSKAVSVLEPVLAPLAESFLALMAPLVAVAAAAVAVAAAYGSIRNAMEGKFGTSVLDGLKMGLQRAVADAKEQLSGFMSAAKGAVGGAVGKKSEGPAKPGEFDNTSQVKKSIDFSEVGKFGTDKSTGVDLGNGVMDFSKNLDDAQKAWKAKMIATADSVAKSFNATVDANADLQEAFAKQQDAQETAATAVGGMWTQLLQNKLPGTAGAGGAAPPPITATSAAGAGVQAASGGMGLAGSMMGSFAQGTAAGGPIAGVAAAAGTLLMQSTAFQKIMGLINKLLTVIIQAINPILSAVLPALTVLLGAVSAAIKSVVAAMQPLMAPITKLVTTVMLIIQPFINLATQLSTQLMPIITKILTPVLNALCTALMFLAKFVINGIVNPLIHVWNAIIDMIDGLLGWTGLDLSSLKLHTVSLNTNADAVDAVTKSMNDLDQSSQNIPQGFKVALSAYNATGLIDTQTPATPGIPDVSGDNVIAEITALTSWLQTQPKGTTVASSGFVSSDQLAQQYAQSGGIMGIHYTAATTPGGPLGWTSDNTTTTSSGTAATTKTAMRSNLAMGGGNAGSAINIQNVMVQAATPDLIGQIQSALKNQGYLKSGTPLSGATNRFQYGSA